MGLIDRLLATRRTVRSIDQEMRAKEARSEEQTRRILTHLDELGTALHVQGIESQMRSERLEMMLWAMNRERGETSLESKKRLFMNMPPATGPLRVMQLGCAQLIREFHDLCDAHDIPYWICFGTLLGAVRHAGFIPWDDDVDLGMLRSDLDRLVSVVAQEPDFRMSVVYDPYVFSRQVRFMFADESLPCFLDLFIFDRTESDSFNLFERRSDIRKTMVEHMKDASYYQEWLDQGYLKGSWKENDGTSLSNKIARDFDKTERELEDSQVIRREKGSAIMWGFDNLDDLNGYSWISLESDVFPIRNVTFEGVSCSAPRNIEKFLYEVYGDPYSFPRDISVHTHVELPTESRGKLDFEQNMRRLIR